MLSNHLILCHPLILLPSIFPSIRIFSNMSGLHTRWSVGASASSSGNSGLILGLTGLILQCKVLSRVFSSNTIQKHQFFDALPSTVQLSHPYMTTGKTSALKKKQNFSFDCKDVGRQSDVSAFNTLSRLVIAFLPRSKHLLISWLQWFWSPRQ